MELEEMLEQEKKELEGVMAEYHLVIGRRQGRIQMLEQLLNPEEEESAPEETEEMESVPPPEASAPEETDAAG